MNKKRAAFIVFLVALAAGAGAIALFGPDRRSSRDSPTASRSRGSVSPVSSPLSASSEPTAPGTIKSSPSPKSGQGPAEHPDYHVWNGPDGAVATWQSPKCGQVMQFGAQLYLPGGKISLLPREVEYLGYSLGEQQLWGDRGAPKSLYVTKDKGKTFVEWDATDQDC